MDNNDLISRAAAVAQIKENYCDWCDHTDLCKSCETYDCIATIEQQVPAVDAIPVEWMRNVLEEAKEFPRAEHETIVAIPYLIKRWQKEQEADIAQKLRIQQKEG